MLLRRGVDCTGKCRTDSLDVRDELGNSLTAQPRRRTGQANGPGDLTVRAQHWCGKAVDTHFLLAEIRSKTLPSNLPQLGDKDGSVRNGVGGLSRKPGLIEDEIHQSPTLVGQEHLACCSGVQRDSVPRLGEHAQQAPWRRNLLHVEGGVLLQDGEIGRLLT